MLKADHTWDGKRILIFSSDENLEHMANAHGLSCDGTFYSTPKQWKQILIIGNNKLLCKSYNLNVFQIFRDFSLKVRRNTKKLKNIFLMVLTNQLILLSKCQNHDEIFFKLFVLFKNFINKVLPQYEHS